MTTPHLEPRGRAPNAPHSRHHPDQSRALGTDWRSEVRENLASPGQSRDELAHEAIVALVGKLLYLLGDHEHRSIARSHRLSSRRDAAARKTVTVTLLACQSLLRALGCDPLLGGS